MRNLLKKEPSGDQYVLGIEELRLLLSTYNDFEAEHVKVELIHIIKKIFSEIFLMEPNYTFEEFSERIINIAVEQKKISKKVEDLEAQRQELMDLGRKTRDRSLIPKLEDVNHQIEAESKKHALIGNVSKVIDNPKIRDRIIDFCSYLNRLQFAQKHIPKRELLKIVFEFLWIFNQMPYQYEPSKNNKPKFFEMFVKKFTSIRQSADVSHKQLPGLIGEAQSLIKNGSFNKANDVYHLVLKLYIQAPQNIRNLYYKHLFSLWFKLYFSEHKVI